MNSVGDRNFCPDCGPAAVNHTLTRVTVALTVFTKKITWPFSKAEDMSARFFAAHFQSLIPLIFKVLTFFHLAVITESLMDDNIQRTKYLWKAARRRGIAMRQFRFLNKPTIFFSASFAGETIFFEGLPRPKGIASNALVWMDDKGIMKKKFQAGGIPVAEGGVARTEEEAIHIFNTLKHPVITKPSVGSRSRHTTTHITNQRELISAFKKAKQLSPWVVIEEELQGFVFRITLIGGKLVGALRREPPFVIGDGVSTVSALVIKENINPKRHGGIFHEIALNDETRAELLRQGLTLESIPAKGLFVTLNQKVGRSQGGANTEMISKVHPENKKLFERMAKVIGDPLVGVDFIIQDIERSYAEQNLLGAIECNSLPFLDLHHEPLRGEALDLSSKLWDIVFPTSRRI